jgi:hypothetical protein
MSQRTSKNSSVNAEYIQYKNVVGKIGPNSKAFLNDFVVLGKEPDNWQLKEMQGERNNCSQPCREQHCPGRHEFSPVKIVRKHSPHSHCKTDGYAQWEHKEERKYLVGNRVGAECYHSKRAGDKAVNRMNRRNVLVNSCSTQVIQNHDATTPKKPEDQEIVTNSC